MYLNQVTLTAPSPTHPKLEGPLQRAHGHVPMTLGISPGSQSGLVSPLYNLCFILRYSHAVCPPIVGQLDSDEFWRCFLDHPWYHDLQATGKPHTVQVTGMLQTSPGPALWPSTD